MNTASTNILNPIAEHNGEIIHEGENGSFHFFDKNGEIHTRNNKLCRRERLAWIKSDMDWYSQNGWLN
jgi:hypothetical protein